jgi:hypothetical protein
MNTPSRVAISIAIAAVGLHAQIDPESVRQRDAAIKAFRESPSLAAFSAAGEAIMAASNWRQVDDANPRPPAKDREFEAMKATLAAGVVVSTSALPPLSPPVSSPNERVKLTMLPAVRPSFFKPGEPLFVVALRPFKLVDEDVITLVDALSAVNRLAMRVRVVEPMFFGSNGPYGAWDAGVVEARFEQDARVHGVATDGQLTGYNVRSMKAPVGLQPCASRGGSVIGTRAGPAWVSSTVGWVGQAAQEKAIVATRQSGGAGVHQKLVNETIDLDRDGVPDFATWAGIDESEIVPEVDIPWKAVFVNVGGTWTLGSYRAEPDCT